VSFGCNLEGHGSDGGESVVSSQDAAVITRTSHSLNSMVKHHSVGYRVNVSNLVVDVSEVIQALLRIPVHERKIGSLCEQCTQGVRTLRVESISNSKVGGTAISFVTSKKPKGATSAGLENHSVEHDVRLSVERSRRVLVGQTSNFGVLGYFAGHAHELEPDASGNDVTIEVQPRR
jgi:hypothetical protein